MAFPILSGMATLARSVISQQATLEVVVLHTKISETLHALKTAAQLAQDLSGRIRLLVLEVVPYPLALDKPDVCLPYTQRRFRTLAADAIAEEIDLDFLWEVAGQEEFGFADLGKEYFGAAITPAQSAGLIFRLHSAPIYFYKKGRGHYKAAPSESVQAALAGIEKKKQQPFQ